MDSLSSLVFLILALCADTFTACFVYGTGNVRIPPVSSWIITLLSAGILSASLALGAVLKPFLPPDVPVFLSSSLLVLLGASRFTAAPTKDMAAHANKEKPEILSPSEALFLGAGLSVDNAAAGIGAGLSGSSLPAVLILSLLFGMASVTGGCRLGKRAVSMADMDFSKYSGVILVILGLLKLV